ncbi:MAG: hypothetical protein WKG07_15300 [Hymenobacter sp.]
MLAEQRAPVGIGGYLENRVIYRRSPHFDDATEPRSLHLGVDVWVPAGTPVAAPLPAVVHSLADNNNFGDYGPTVILQHELRRHYLLQPLRPPHPHRPAGAAPWARRWPLARCSPTSAPTPKTATGRRTCTSSSSPICKGGGAIFRG